LRIFMHLSKKTVSILRSTAGHINFTVKKIRARHKAPRQMAIVPDKGIRADGRVDSSMPAGQG
jgi:hypothetical protein